MSWYTATRRLPLDLPPSPILPLASEPLSAKFSQCAVQKLKSRALATGIPLSELLRQLVRAGWAVANDGDSIDSPIGTNVRLPAGEPGANGAADLPPVADPAVLDRLLEAAASTSDDLPRRKDRRALIEA